MKRLIPLLLLVFALAPSFLMGEGAWFYWKDFSGGLDVRTMQTDDPGNSMIVLQDAITVDGHIEKRGLFSQISNTFSSYPVRALTSYFNDATQKHYLVAVAGNTGYVSEDGGYTFNMFFSGIGVDVTNASTTVLFSDSGVVRQFRDFYFSGWRMKLPNGVYNVNRFGVSANTAVDTIVLETPYSGTTATDTCHWGISPFIGGDHVDFTEWHHKLFIADGVSPVKVWDGATFRKQLSARFYQPIDSFKIDTVFQNSNYEFYFDVDENYHYPSLSQWTAYGSGHYCLVWSDNDSTCGTNLLFSKPVPLEYTWSYSSTAFMGRINYALDTAFMKQKTESPDATYNILNSGWVYITYPNNSQFLEYTVVDSGSFDAVTEVEHIHNGSDIQYLYDYTDSQKTWTATQYNYDATYLCFTPPYSDTTRWYSFRCFNRTSAPASVVLRVGMYHSAYASIPWKDGNKYLSTFVTKPRQYWIVRAKYGSLVDMPTAKFVREQANVLWTAGFVDAPRQVWVSEPGSDSIFGDFIFDVHGERSDQINGIFDIQNYVVFAMGSGVTQINGNTNETFGQSPLVYGYGVKGANSMFQFQSNFIAYGDKGFSLFGSGDPQEVSAPIFPILRDSLNRAAIPKISGIDTRKGVLVSLPITTSAENNRLYWMNTNSGAWTQWTGLHGASFRVWNSPEGIDTLRIGSSDSGAVLSYKADYTSTVDLVAQTPFLTGGELTADKQMQQYYVEAAFDYGDKMQVTFYVDNNLSTAVWTDTIISVTPASRSAMYVRDARAVVYGHSVSMKIKSLAADTAVVQTLGMMLAPAREMRNK